MHSSLAFFALATLVPAVLGQAPVWGQCGGIGWTGPTTCASGSSCVKQNDYYSQCIPGASQPTSTPTNPTSTASTSSSGSTPTSGPIAGNPYGDGHSLWLTPYYAAEVKDAAAQISDASIKAKALKVADIPTFTWFDVAAKVPTLKTYLADAASKGGKQLVQIVVYDLPDRDCAAAASNGEYSFADGGAAKYKAYIDGIRDAINAYPDVRVVAIVEPDSLANLVTNMNVSKCSNAANNYKNSTIYALQTLNLPNVYMYLDAGHAGWLGWPANLQPAATLFSQIYQQAGKPGAVRGLATNVANYNALRAAAPDTKITQGNPNYDEIHYIEALAPLLQSGGFPTHFVVDLGRSGVQNIRDQWGDWCNVKGAGFGTRPTTNTGSSLIDAIVWIKPGGECDGTSNTSATRYDYHCGLSDAHQPAPEAGTWFQDYFVNLVTNANPSL
ncbi:cellobiohydrolase [Auricularia subglabra TFB-10046 SS5]|nr:cellobiohydrolase [Auricularia subglabra TFB-10046 SS5]